MATHDLQGREYARIADVKTGDMLEDDGGFGCLDGVSKHVVQADMNGQLFIPCDEGQHYLDGQVDDGDHCVGLYPVHMVALTGRQLKLAREAITVAFVDDDAPVYDHEDGFAEVQRLADAFDIPHPRSR